MDFQLLFKWWPWSSFNCEICFWEVWKNRNRSGDSFHFQRPASNTGRILHWGHLIASGFCSRGSLHWAASEREREEKKKWPRSCYRGNTKAVLLYRKLSPSLSWPSSLYLTFARFFTLSDFSIYRDLQGPKGWLKEDCQVLKFHLLGCKKERERDTDKVWGGLAVQHSVTWNTLEYDAPKTE